MKIYLVSQPLQGYDTYDAVVVIAKDEAQALELTDGKIYCDVKIECIGNALEGSEAGLVCESFNAG